MKDFEYAQPNTESEAVALLSSGSNTAILAGGTDLVGLMKNFVVSPERVVDVTSIESMNQIEIDSAGNTTIGAGVHLDEFLHASPMDVYPAIKQIIQGISSIQLQAQGTIGGELLRRPTCWYYRAGHGLLANQGKMVVEGDNRYHAIMGNRGSAKFVSASRLAPALISLNARVRIVGPTPDEEYVVPLESIYQIPRNNDEHENALQPGQLLTHIFVPATGDHLSAAYEIKHGEGPDQPLASAVATLGIQTGIVRQAKIALGQVAPIPWISAEAEKVLVGNRLSQELAERAGIEATASAIALSKNEYKIQLAQVAVTRAILRAAGKETGGF